MTPLATELGTGYISLSVRYSSAMSKVSRDLTGVESAARRSGDKAGRALSSGLAGGSRKGGSEAAKSLQVQLGEAFGTRIGERVGRAISAPIRRIMGTTGTEAGKQFSNNFERESSKSSRRSGSKVGGSILGGLAGVATKGVAVLAPLVGIGSLVNAGFSRLTAIDDAKAKLIGLGNSAEDVQKIMDSALAAVKGTSFGMDEAATTAATAVAAGIKPGEELTNYLTLVSDAAAIAGTSMEEMGAIFNKVETGGRVFTDDLNQLADRGLPIFTWLQEEYGVTAEELRKMVESGEVDSATFQKVVNENIGGAAQEMGKSVSGSLKNLSASFSRFGAALVGPVFDKLGGLFNGLTGVVDKATTAVGPLMDRLGGMFSEFFENKILPAVREAMPVVKTIFNDLREGASKLLPSVIPVAKALGTTLMGAVKALIPALAPLAGAIKNAWSGLGALAAALGPKLAPLGEALVKIFKALMPVVKVAGIVLGGLIKIALAVATKALPVVATVLTFFANVLGSVIGWLTGTAIPAIGGFFKAIGSAAMFLWNNVLKPVGAGIASVFRGIGTVAMWLWKNIFVPVFKGLSFPVRVAWAAIQIAFKAMKAAFTVLGTVAQALWKKYMVPAWEGIKSAIATVWGYVEPVWNNFTDGLKVIGDTAMDLWNKYFVPAWEGIKSAVSTAWDFVSGIFDKFKTGFQSVVDGVKSIGKGLADAIRNAFNGVVEVIKKPLRAIGGILASMPTSALGVDVPGADAVVSFGNRLQGLKRGGIAGVDRRGRLYGPGTGTSDSILAVNKWGVPTAMVSDGEGVVTARAMGQGGAALVAALNAGWVPPVELLRGMLPGYAEGLNPGADYLRRYIMQSWPEISSIGGRRSEDGLGEHSSGNAIDVMIPGWDTERGKSLGDTIASFMIANRQAIGLDGMIWRQTSYGYGGSFSSGKVLGDRGNPTQNHMDHIHVILGKGRGAGAPAVDKPTRSLTGGRGGSVSPGSGRRPTQKQISNAEDRVTDLEARLETDQLSLQETLDNPKAKESTKKSKQDKVDKTTRELEQARDELESLREQYDNFSGDLDSGGSNNPYVKLVEAIKEIMPDFGQLADIGVNGLKESLLPPGFADPMELGATKAASGVLGFISSLVQDPTARSILGMASNAVGGNSSGVVSSIESLIPKPFGTLENGEEILNPTAAQNPVNPDPGSPTMVPDAAGAGGGGTTNIDNSVHVAEGGMVGTDPVKVMDKTKRQQTAAQTPHLGTRRFV